jgi:hypothetical protein
MQAFVFMSRIVPPRTSAGSLVDCLASNSLLRDINLGSIDTSNEANVVLSQGECCN